jgi:hypothetical protein
VHTAVRSIHCTIFLGVLAVAAAGGSPAQSVTPLHYDPAAVQTRVVHDYRVAAGDSRNHSLRLYDLRHTFTRKPPIFGGSRATEMWEQGQADTIDQNGAESAYVTYILDNGNKVFGRYRGTRKSFRWPDGTRHFDVEGEITLTGGTGPMTRIRGAIKVRLALDPGAESSQGDARGEYWFEPEGSTSSTPPTSP